MKGEKNQIPEKLTSGEHRGFYLLQQSFSNSKRYLTLLIQRMQLQSELSEESDKGIFG